METLSYCQLMQRCGELESRLVAVTEQRDALVVENVALKAGQLFFMYSDETGFEIHKSQDAALASAKDMIAVCREEAAQDGWPEDADTICWGLIMQKAIEMDFEQPSEKNGWIGWSEYKLTPNIETPATDAAIAALRAEGIHFTANRLLAAYDHGFINKPAKEVADMARMIITAIDELPTATPEDLTDSYSKQSLAEIARQLRESKGESKL